MRILTPGRILLMLFLFAAGSAVAQTPQWYTGEVVAVYPHDANAFTQGLLMEDGILYEGTGREGESSLRQVDLDSGTISKRYNLENHYFGEGITLLNDRFYQLTWRANTGFVYDRGFQLVDSFIYSGEGWGLTDDGEVLIMSDGTSTLRFIDPETFKLIRRVEVTFRGEPLSDLNELEYIDGEVWSNVWYQDVLVAINPESGEVTSVVDLSALYPDRPDRDQVLNGIAWDEESRRLFVTGKLWPSLYEIRLVATEAP